MQAYQIGVSYCEGVVALKPFGFDVDSTTGTHKKTFAFV
jgi:hypothetical protein